MKTILCNEEQKEQIYHDLLRSAETNALCDVQVLTLSNLLRCDDQETEDAAPIVFSHILQEVSDQFPIYRDMFRYPAFIREILSFARECALYRITADDLPSETASQRELREILRLALKLPLPEAATAANYDTLLEKASKLKNLEIRIRFEADPFKVRFLNDLKAAAGIDHDTPEPEARHQELRYGRSVRQEVEAVAQDIVRKEGTSIVVLSSYQAMIPVVEQVFQRYGIPYSCLYSPVHSSILHAYCALVQLALAPSVPHLLDALRADGFPVFCKEPLLSWLDRTLTGVMPCSVADRMGSDLLKSDAMRAAANDERAASFFALIQEDLNFLLSAGSPKEAFTHAYQVLRKSPLLRDSTALGCALALTGKLNRTLNEVNTNEDADFLLQELRSSSQRVSSCAPAPCFITDLSHPGPRADTVYVLGCSAGSFPGTPVKKGLFDESYTALVSAYPSMEHRYELWTNGLSWLTTSSDHVIFSYAVSDYQGREIQPAFAVTSKLPNEQPWSLEVKRPLPPKAHVLDPDTALPLYTQEDGRIHSSISRIERYFYCPYSWFIQSGLKVRVPMESGRNMATAGNLQHAFLEYAVKTYGKQYTDVSKEEIFAFLDPAFEDLYALYPNELTELSLTRERMADGLFHTLQLLKESEAATLVWKPAGQEEAFDQVLTEHVQLNGIIDRIDESPSSVRVMDYKSSAKALYEEKIKAGIQLQLPSYSIIAQSRSDKRPAGSYYISMKSESTSLTAGSFKKTNKGGVPMNTFDDEEALKEMELAKRRIAGWAFEDPAIIPETYKKFFTPTSGEYDYPLIKETILELYEYFYREAVSGRIDVAPVLGACMFCDYQAICRHHGEEGPVVPLINAGQTFKKTKLEEN